MHSICRARHFATSIYEQYKAGRAEIHEDLAAAICFRASHGRSTRHSLSWLTKAWRPTTSSPPSPGSPTSWAASAIVVTGDKDCRQLITDRVKVYNIRKNEILDRDFLRQDWGIRPDQVVDYQALVGDSTDNVPGVPLIGPKAARDLLEKYGTLDNILAHADEVSGAAKKENLKKYREQALMSRVLVKLDTCVPIEIPWRSARSGRRRSGRGPCAVRRIRLPPAGGTIQCDDRASCATTGKRRARRHARCSGCVKAGLYDDRHARSACEALIGDMRKQQQISIDTETTHIWPRWAEIVGISLAWNENAGLLLAAPRAGRLAALGPASHARRLAADAGRPGYRQTRPEPQVRPHRAPRRGRGT